MTTTAERREIIIEAIKNERAKQDAKWGEQNHPDGTGPHTTPVAEIVRGPGDAIVNRHYAFGLAFQATSATDKHAAAGTVTWADILLEEVFEALAESDPDKLRTELVQVAAVAAQWVEAIDRREGAEVEDPDPMTACPKCGRISVKYRQGAWGDNWDCTAADCNYHHYFSIGD